MKLSAESFRELAHALTGKKAPEGTERRRSTRVEVQTRLPLSLFSKGQQMPSVPIMVRDVSPRGINILYPEALPAGTQFTVEITGGGKKIHLLCTVMHSQRVSSGLFSIGAEFTCVLPSHLPLPNDDRAVKHIRESILD
jgi:hypothetical protein